MKEKPSYYAIIPANVRYADITPNAKLLYGEITALCSKEGYCWASNNYFAELYDVDVRTIKRWVSELLGIEAIKITGNTSQRHIELGIKLPLTRDKNAPSTRGKIAPHSITSVITTSIKERESTFYPPSLEEVKSYCLERANGINPASFIDFYTSKGWMVGRNKMKDWKAGIRNWENRNNPQQTKLTNKYADI